MALTHQRSWQGAPGGKAHRSAGAPAPEHPLYLSGVLTEQPQDGSPGCPLPRSLGPRRVPLQQGLDPLHLPAVSPI